MLHTAAAGGRPRWRAYLLLSRVSNLPTVWSNVLGATVASGAAVRPDDTAYLAAAVSLMYVGGMFLNDAFDREWDAVHRSDRPLPAGDVTPRGVFAAGYALLGAGALMIALRWMSPAPIVSTLLLSAAIVFYDYRHKQNPWSAVVMGGCRGLIYVIVAAALTSVRTVTALAAGVQTAYVLLLTVVAKRVGPRAGVIVPVLIAGISLLDAAVIMLAGGDTRLAAMAAAGFLLTLALQRVVPGT